MCCRKPNEVPELDLRSETTVTKLVSKTVASKNSYFETYIFFRASIVEIMLWIMVIYIAEH